LHFLIEKIQELILGFGSFLEKVELKLNYRRKKKQYFSEGMTSSVFQFGLSTFLQKLSDNKKYPIIEIHNQQETSLNVLKLAMIGHPFLIPRGETERSFFYFLIPEKIIWNDLRNLLGKGRFSSLFPKVN